MEISMETSQTFPIEFVIDGDTEVAVTDATMEIGTFDGGSIHPTYQGDYEFTPAEDEQIINIKGHSAKENIIIKPIPSNYGRIIYNGTYIRIE